MTPSYSVNRSKVKYYYYLCTSTSKNKVDAISHCPHKRVPLVIIQDAVIAYICSLTYESEFSSFANRIGTHNSAIAKQELTMATAIDQLNDEIVELKVKKDRLFDNLMTHSLLTNERKIGTERLQELDAKERQLKAQLHKQEFEKTALAETKIDTIDLRYQLETFATNHLKWNKKQLHAALHQLVQEIRHQRGILSIKLKQLPWSIEVPFRQNNPPP
jgi:capsule polysaccharide modification protein KpsS